MSGTRLIGCVVALLFLVSCGAQPTTTSGTAAPAQSTGLQATSQQTATPSPRTITVSGSASVMVVPDEVTITLGVETSDPVLASARARNDEVMAKVVQATKDLGVDAKYVQTDYVHAEPRYQDSYTQRTFLGYCPLHMH